ncbi:hypothetical protein BJY01DRAFT_249273 [Aspergillus pseudoustus]|uniref:EthD domain-containing protein n=1 Tax=Aspergillus pseudoustus TaxID=1810923 RepID=A0ABR4JSI3_9EURO
MTSPYTGPGLLYVGSRTKQSSGITEETYNDWYDNVHIPHILETSGVQTAARHTVAPGTADSLNWPFLAIYPIGDLHYLTTQEFADIPLVDNLLPGPSHSCVDCAEFDQRHYATVGEFQVGEVASETSEELLVVHFNLPPGIARDDDADPANVQEWYLHQLPQDVNQHVQIHRLILARRFSNDDPDKPPSYIALHRVHDKGGLQQHLAALRRISVNVSVYTLWKEFGP